MIIAMTNAVSLMDDIMAALPAVQEAVRHEIAARRVAGDFIAGLGVDGSLVTSRPPYFDLAERRQRLVEEHAARLAELGPMQRKSAV